MEEYFITQFWEKLYVITANQTIVVTYVESVHL